MRSSNIELLRIVSMLMIVMFHFSVHGAWLSEGPLASDIAVEMLSFGGKLGVNCFVLITGYFMVSRTLSIRSLLRIVLQTWFYSFVILGVFLIWDPTIVTPEKLRKAMLPLCTGEYWFVTCYLALMVASPFLNVLYRHLSPRGRSGLVAVSFVVLSLIPTLTIFNPLGSDLVWFFYLYLLGGWIRERVITPAKDPEEPHGKTLQEARLHLLDPLRIVERLGAAASFVGGVAFVWVSMALIGWARRAAGFDLIAPDYFIWQYMVPTFLASVGLMVMFAHLKMPNRHWINTVASCALGVYLIHDNPLMRVWLWPHFAWIYDLGSMSILAFGIGSAVVVFALCSAIDYLRMRLLEQPLLRAIDRRWGSQMERMQKALDKLEGPDVRGKTSNLS